MVRYVVTSALFLSVLSIGCGGRQAEVPAASATTAQSAPASTPAVDSAAAAAPATAPATTAPAAVAAAPAAPPAGTVLASETFSKDPNLRADLTEVRRVSGGALLVKWRIANTGQSNVYYDFSWDDLYYVDPAENKKYEYLKDSEGNRIIDVHWGTVKPGETRTNWAKFPAPPATSTKISLTLPKFPPLEDVPVAP